MGFEAIEDVCDLLALAGSKSGDALCRVSECALGTSTLAAQSGRGHCGVIEMVRAIRKGAQAIGGAFFAF